MEEMVQHAIFGNVGTMIAFRVGAEDAELLEKEFMPEFVTQDLVNLGFKNIYVKLMIDGITSRPFSAETMPPFPLPAESFRNEIIKASRERYATARAVVEDKIRSFTTGGEAAVGVFSAVAAPLTREGMAQADPQDVSPPRPGGVSAAHHPGGRVPSSTAGLERPMYETICALDGKKILVPFKPDGVRPVYCEEHMDMIKFRSKASRGGNEGAKSSHTAAEAKPESISLDHLRPPQPSKNNEQKNQPSPKKEFRLAELRKALEESMRPSPSSLETPPQAPLPLSSEPKTLQPGETLRFE